MKHLTLLLVLFVGFTIIGCDNNKPLSMLLQESTKPTSDIADATADCYKGLDIDTVNSEYLLVFDKDCIDAVVLGDNYTADAIAEMVTQNDFRLERKTIKLTGIVNKRLTDGGHLILLPDGYNTEIWITPPWLSEESRFDASKTIQYRVGSEYTFDVFVRYIDREGDTRDDPKYIVITRLIIEENQAN